MILLKLTTVLIKQIKFFYAAHLNLQPIID